MKIKFIVKEDAKSTETRLMQKIAKEMQKLGHEIDYEKKFKHPDAVIANGAGVWRQIEEYLETNNKAPLFVYEWDCYPWTYPNKLPSLKNKIQGYPVFPKSKYSKILNRAQVIFCPSNSVKKRIDEIFQLGNKCRIVEPFFEQIDGGTTSEGGYIYHPVRKYRDPQLGWLERFSKIYNIPIFRPEHGLTQEEYKSTVLNASLILTEYTEASTGGLTLLEGFARGKKILFCDSIYVGANDYFPQSVDRFEKGSFEDFSSKILKVLNNQNPHKQTEINKIKLHFSVESMANRIDFQISQFFKGVK